ncbi:MAG TPA: nucleotidyltransferase domain-containing protein [Chitinophagaceae bacterium]|nr:nucleotidyltransferase domain-containing protein [Chitinophagaceae bacterium]
MDKLQILKELKNHLENCFHDNIKNVILFGSQVKGLENIDSDYDILIVLNKDYNKKDENYILDLCYDIDLKYNIFTDVHLLSVNELNTRRGKQPIFINALKNGIYA